MYVCMCTCVLPALFTKYLKHKSLCMKTKRIEFLNVRGVCNEIVCMYICVFNVCANIFNLVSPNLLLRIKHFYC